MKKLFLAVAAIIITAASVNAQTTFSIAANAGSGTKTGYKLSAGGDVQVEFPATTGLKITASAGYQNFAFEFTYPAPIGTIKDHFSVIPILAGAKFNLGKALYGHAQLGYSVSTTKGGGGEFTYAPSLGYGFGKSFDISAKYLSVGKVNAILARLAYTFGN
ncbi:MAG TPA: hypothetical protein VMY77_11785 [Chitinophagaceae bacterium]|nr:hypothetical protein [Chitinophagaceae bacterium]